MTVLNRVSLFCFCFVASQANGGGESGCYCKSMLAFLKHSYRAREKKLKKAGEKGSFKTKSSSSR
jgi:hypothetical protein